MVIQGLEESGFAILPQFLSLEFVEEIISIVENRSDLETPHGVRNFFSFFPELLPVFKENVIEPLLGEAFLPIRTIYFDKVSGKNWNVAWHQDTTINVVGALPSTGFNNASDRGEFLSVEPPSEIIDNIVTIRVHLDDANESNGCLRVLPDSHKLGRVKSEDLLGMVENSALHDCVVHRGDIMLMKPFLFHSSRKSVEPTHRRVIHMECCSAKLPAGLEWYESPTSKAI